jgi:hypothetical protein
MEVPPGHSIPSVGLGDGAASCEQGERHIGVVPKKEPYFSPPVRRTGQGEVEVGIDSMPRSEVDVHATQNRYFRTRAMWELSVKEVVL